MEWIVLCMGLTVVCGLLHQGPDWMARLKWWGDGLVSKPIKATQLREVTRADWLETVLGWAQKQKD